MPKRSWTDDDLRAAVASSKSYLEVATRLGITPRGRNHVRIQTRIRQLALDTTHFQMQRVDEAQLRAAVQRATSFEKVAETLSLPVEETALARLRNSVVRRGLDTSHFVVRPRRTGPRPRRWTDEQLRAAVAASSSYAEVIRRLGLIPAGGNYDQVTRKIRELGLDTDHFGLSNAFRTRKAPSPRPLDEVLVANRWTTSHNLKQRLLRAGLKTAECELCGWKARAPDGRVPIELDHINGDKNDNRLENLRILCPNCHALQPTHRGLNKRSRRS